MITFEESKKQLHSRGNIFTDEQIKIIRDFLYNMANISLDKNSQTINHKNNKNEK